MGWVAGPSLVTGTANAGGLGILGVFGGGVARLVDDLPAHNI